MKTVANLPLEQAHMLKADLEFAGITVALQDQFGTIGVSSIRVQVSDGDLEQACLIVDKFEAISANRGSSHDQQNLSVTGSRWSRLGRIEIIMYISFVMILWLISYLKR